MISLYSFSSMSLGECSLPTVRCHSAIRMCHWGDSLRRVQEGIQREEGPCWHNVNSVTIVSYISSSELPILFPETSPSFSVPTLAFIYLLPGYLFCSNCGQVITPTRTYSSGYTKERHSSPSFFPLKEIKVRIICHSTKL